MRDTDYSIAAETHELVPQLYAASPIARMGNTDIPERTRLTHAQLQGLLKGIAGRESNYGPFLGYALTRAADRPHNWMLQGWPTIARDGGFGLYQLTNGNFGAGNDALPNYTQVWNWKENLEGGLSLLAGEKVRASISVMDNNLPTANNNANIAYMATPETKYCKK